MEKDLKIAGRIWNLTITRNMSFWHQMLSNPGGFENVKDFGLDASIELLAITKEGRHSFCFVSEPNHEKYREGVMDGVSTKEKVDALREKIERFGKELLEAVRILKENQTPENYKNFTKLYQRYTGILYPTGTIGRRGSEMLTERLLELGTAPEKIPEIISIVTYPEQHTPLFLSQIDLFEIGAKVQDRISEAEKENLLKSWLSKYENIPANWCEEPWFLKDAEEQLQNILKKNCKEELEKIQKDHEGRVLNAKKVLQDINDEKVSNLAYALAEATYFNEFRKNVFSRVGLEYRSLFQKVAEMCGFSDWRDCYYLTPEEMLEVMEGKKVSLQEIKEQRKVIGYYTNEDGKNIWLKPEETKQVSDYIEMLHGKNKEQGESPKMIKGFSASRGKVTGIAKIVLSRKDFDKVNPGDILVAPMTSVDYVPIMEKAAAFVTNEGGITSHASIVAREMGKPCIIGTKNATQVFKDGDVVEVDAMNGIIKVI